RAGKNKLVAPSTINRELDVLEAAYFRARDSWEHPVRPINWGSYRFPSDDKKQSILNVDEAREGIRLAKTKSPDAADAIQERAPDPHQGPRRPIRAAGHSPGQAQGAPGLS